MADVPAIAIQSIVGAMATDDGKHALIKMLDADNQEIVLGLDSEHLLGIIDLAASTRQACKANQKMDPRQLDIVKATWFELGKDLANGQPVLTMTFGSGGKLTFAMDVVMAEQMLETLEVILGRSPAPMAGTLKN